jgi:hypothetical protein
MSITRDTRPPDPAQQAQRAKLDDLARALRHLHSALLEAVKLDFEKLNGKVGGPFHLFQLVTNDPFFQWLRPLSGLMASLDELIDEKRLLSDTEILEVKTSVLSLFEQSDPSGFGANFETRVRDSQLVAGQRDDVTRSLEALT